eukprot:COSAG05_NODE_13_length_36464_cov_294.169449_2_plen_134_part_00
MDGCSARDLWGSGRGRQLCVDRRCRGQGLRILEELFSFKLWLSTSSCVQKKFAYHIYMAPGLLVRLTRPSPVIITVVEVATGQPCAPFSVPLLPLSSVVSTELPIPSHHPSSSTGLDSPGQTCWQPLDVCSRL